MKRVFSRKRRDYTLFAAALAFGFTATLSVLFLKQNIDSKSANARMTSIVQQDARTQSVNNVAFAYASPDNVAVAAPETVSAPVALLQPVDAAPVPRQHYIAKSEAPKKDSMTETVAITKGDTLDQVFETFGIPKGLSVEAVNSLKGVFSTQKFRIGQQITLLFKPASDGSRTFRGYRFAADPLRDVIVIDDKGDGSFDANVVEKELRTVISAKSGQITGSLAAATKRAGVPYSILAEMIRVYSYSVDFQRDIHEGDHFEVMYEAKADANGHTYSTGNMLYARLVLDDKELPIYRYEDATGRVDFLKADGTSNRRGLIKTPIDGARISSGFGFRQHPVLGYNKMHKGIDFAAPIGTPIYAAGDGVIKTAGQVNGYGNFIKLVHNANLATGYGHISRFAAGIRPGVHVSQGQVIAYVGMTGRTTGPHLHYEVLINNAQVNPVGVNVPTSSQLAGAELKKFKSYVANRQVSFKQALIAGRTETASR